MSEEKASFWERVMQNVTYCINGVWNDTRALWSVKTLKIINLSVRSFLRHDLQMRAGSLTYNTVLAIVPALAMLFAIGRGFGFQNLLQSELFRYFPAQQQALESALKYVDNYLSQASQGAFIGIGLVFLLWTLHSLMSNVEDTFNYVWGVTKRRSVLRKFTDYSAILLLLPLMMICSHCGLLHHPQHQGALQGGTGCRHPVRHIVPGGTMAVRDGTVVCIEIQRHLR